MPPINIVDSSLLSHFWFTTEFSKVSAAYDTLHPVAPDGVVPAEAPAPDADVPAVTSDTGLMRLVGHSGDARYKEVFGRAKALGERANDPWSRAGDIARRLGLDLDELANDLRTMADVPQVSTHVAKDVLSALLRSEEMVYRAVREEPLSRAGKLALLNAGLGCVQLVLSGGATVDSLFELVYGEVYDITRPADVLKLAVKTAKAARAAFVGEDRLNAVVCAYNDAVDASDLSATEKAAKKVAMRTLRLEIVAQRTALSAALDIPYDLGDGSKATLEAKIKAVRETLRAFRYDLDRVTGKPMTFMEGIRRRMDDLTGANRTALTAASFGPLNGLEDDFNAKLMSLRLTGRAIPHTASQAHCKEATDLTHTANNRIRYYFTGKEQRLEAFRAKAHKVLDTIAQKGGSRTIQFTVSGNARFNAGVAKMQIGGKYLETATVSVDTAGGEVTVTFSNGGALFASGAVGYGLSGGEEATKWSAADRSNPSVLGASVGGQGNLSLSHQKTFKYRTMEDFIASLSGASDLVDRSKLSTVACLGRIGSFLAFVGKGIAHGARAFATWTGLRIHKSREDNAAYVAKMHRLGVMSGLDQMLAHREHGVLTQSGTTWTAGVSGGATGGVNLGSFGGTVTSETDGKVKAVKNSFLSVSGSLTGSYTRVFAYNAVTYRSLLESARSFTTDRLEQTAGGWYRGLAVPEGASRAKAALKAIEAEMIRTEDSFVEMRTEQDIHAFEWFVNQWKMFACFIAYIERQPGAPDVSPWEDRLRTPHVTLTDEEAVKMQDEAFKVMGGKGAHVSSVDFSVNLSTLDRELGKVTDGKIVTAGLKEGVSQLVPTDLVVHGTFTHTEPAVKISACPWDNGGTNTYSVALSPSLTVRAILEVAARRHVDTLTELTTDQERETAFKSTLRQFAAGLGASIGKEIASEVWGMTMGSLAKVAPKLAKFLKAPVVADATGGLEVGFDVNYTQTLSFVCGGGRLLAVSFDETESASGSLGLRFPVGPSGLSLGFGIGESISTREIGRWAFPDPAPDCMLAQTERFLRSEDHEGLMHLLTHNKPGSLRLVRVIRNLPHAEDGDEYFEGDVRVFNDRLTEAFQILGREVFRAVVTAGDRDRQDRAVKLHDRLSDAMRRIAAADANEDDAERLDKLQDVLEALADTFVFARATNEYVRDETTGALVVPE